MAEQQNQQGVYLSKQGKVFGPFTRAHLEQLKRTGEYLSYSFMWDPSISPEWKPVHMPPSPPPTAEKTVPSRPQTMHASAGAADGEPHVSVAPAASHEVSPSHSHQPAASAAQGMGSSSSARFHVICHDNRKALSGMMVLPTIRGFTLLTNDLSSDLPGFGAGNKVWINLLDEQSGQTENFQAVISAVASRDGKWAFEVFWEQPSAIVSSQVSFGKF